MFVCTFVAFLTSAPKLEPDFDQFRVSLSTFLSKCSHCKACFPSLFLREGYVRGFLIRFSLISFWILFYLTCSVNSALSDIDSTDVRDSHIWRRHRAGDYNRSKMYGQHHFTLTIAFEATRWISQGWNMTASASLTTVKWATLSAACNNKSLLAAQHWQRSASSWDTFFCNFTTVVCAVLLERDWLYEQLQFYFLHDIYA